jgi:hypothetical protein
MKTMIAALAFVLLMAGSTFAASPSVRQLHEGRASTFVPFSGDSVGPYSLLAGREWLIRSNW